MCRMMKLIVSLVMMLGLALTPVMPMMLGGQAWAEEPQPSQESGGGGASKKPETTILPDDWAGEGGIEKILQFVLKFVVYGLGAAAVLGVTIAGVMYMTARDSEAQVAKAKKRLYEVVIGLVAWALMYAVLNWLIPGSLDF